MEFPKVLVCSPTYRGKDYCFDGWSENVNNFTYPNMEVMLVDNSEDRRYLDRIRSKGFTALYVEDKGKGIIPKTTEAHERCRDYAIKNNFEYILHLETDIFPPIDIIERLLNHGKGVVGAMYDIYMGKKRGLMLQQNEPLHRFVRAYRTVKMAEESEPIICDGTVKQIYHIGLGCLLIKRNVFEMIPFRFIKDTNIHADTWFANDCFANNIPIFVDTLINCKHENQSWANKELFT